MIHMTFYIHTKGYTVPGSQGTHDNFTQIPNVIPEVLCGRVDRKIGCCMGSTHDIFGYTRIHTSVNRAEQKSKINWQGKVIKSDREKEKRYNDRERKRRKKGET